MISINKEKRENIISWVLVAIGAIVYISLVFNRNVWLDEAFTASLVRTDMAGVLERSMADTLPPLYNIILKISTDIFGYKVPVMKLTSVLPMIITMIISATTVRKRHGFKASCLFTVALFTMPNLLFFGVEIRMYSLGFLFATASGIYAYEFIMDYNKKNLIIFTVLSVLAGYSHHFAFVSVGFVYLFLLLYYFLMERENIKRWFICVGLTVILYFPCLVVTLKQFKSVSGYFSMPDVTLPVFIKYMRYPYTVGNTVASIMLLVSVASLACFTVYKIVSAIRTANSLVKVTTEDVDNDYSANMSNISEKYDVKDVYALSMFLVYYGVLLFGTIVSKLMTANIFVDRYLFFAHGMLWLFFAIEAGQLKKFYYGMIAVFIFAGVCGYINEVKIEYDTNPDALVSFLEDSVDDGDILYTIEDSEEMAFCLPFYDEGLTNYEDLDEALKAAKSNDSELWLTIIDYSEYDFKELSERGLKAEYEDTFTFDRYTFDMYKVISE
ncbi:MAG: glycosyltransferase family 39 protein [Lachnospiraceae bacterium]|nr:glycosyltransferase family 39 protein [Lachnospiraceae bacterium]